MTNAFAALFITISKSASGRPIQGNILELLTVFLFFIIRFLGNVLAKIFMRVIFAGGPQASLVTRTPASYVTGLIKSVSASRD
jgi:formate hydrogenlyase subunit 3/multisubunit Na+/H+ antiporter MnhD subunit